MVYHVISCDIKRVRLTDLRAQRERFPDHTIVSQRTAPHHKYE